MKSTLSNISFIVCAFGIISKKNHCHTQGHLALLLCYLLGVLQFCNSFWVNFVVERSLSRHPPTFFCMWIAQLLWCHLLKRLSLLPCISFAYLWKVNWYLCESITGSLIYSIDVNIYSFTNTTLSLLLWLYSRSWSQVVSFLWLCSSMLYWLFWIFCLGFSIPARLWNFLLRYYWHITWAMEFVLHL